MSSSHVTKAALVFGSRDAAEEWFESPAMGLDQQRPSDIVLNPKGISVVMDYLVRIENGVYT